MMKRKKLLSTMLVCVLIAVFLMPAVISILSSNGKTGADASEGETDLGAVPLGSSGNSGTTEVVSTESTDTSYNPSVAVDASGNVHVAWQDYTDYAGSGTDTDIFYKRYQLGVGWTITEVVSTESTSSSWWPSLAVDSSGDVHIAWQDQTDYMGAGTAWDIFYKRYEVGVGWTITEVVSTESTDGAHEASVAVDTSGNVHVAWWDYDWGIADVYYRRYEVGVGWTITEEVSTETDLHARYQSVAVDSSGNLHIAWASGSEVQYKRYAVGVGWTTPEVVGGDNPRSPSLAVDTSGNVHVAWWDFDFWEVSGYDIDVFYSRREVGVGWTTTNELVSTDSIEDSYYPSVAVDSSGNTHIAWREWTGTDEDILYKRYGACVGWTTTEVVSTESTGNSLNPSVAVDSGGNLHIAWHDYTDYAGAGTDADIFYKRFEFALLTPAEPTSLRDIVEFPGAAHLRDLSETTYPSNTWEIQVDTTEVVSTESANISRYPSLAVDSNRNVHVAWWDITDYAGAGTDGDIFYKRYVVGVGWTTTEVVSTESTDASTMPSVAVDASGNVHVAWLDSTDYAGSGSDADIFYKRYVVGVGWTTTEVVSTESTDAAYEPSVAVDASGNVHVAWDDATDYAGSGTDRDIFYKRYQLGVGWTTTEVVSTESTSSSVQPSVAVDSSGNVHVAWFDYTDYAGSGTDKDIFYKRYEVGVGWTTTEVVSTESTAHSERPCLAVDSNGNVHVTWIDRTDYAGSGSDADIFYKRYVVGVGWTTTEVVSTESTDASFSMSTAADSGGNIHVAWRDNTDYAGAGTDDDIFYKRYEVGVGWTTTEVVSTESTGDSSEPSTAVDSGGNIHVAWDDETDYAGAGTDRDVFYKWAGPDKVWMLTKMMSTVEGLPETKIRLESKGFVFKLAASSVSAVVGGLNYTPFSGSVLSWWSEISPDGIRALLVAAKMDDGKSMVFGAITNLLPSELIPETDPYIIVNAMPYTYIQWFYYDQLNDRIVTWSYWWYDSHTHPNWFWNIYWKWRNYVDEYHRWHCYLPWWWWFWHYTYDKHWHNWSAQFPY